MDMLADRASQIYLSAKVWTAPFSVRVRHESSIHDHATFGIRRSSEIGFTARHGLFSLPKLNVCIFL